MLDFLEEDTVSSEEKEASVHFVFNTESMSDLSEPNTIEEALRGAEGEQWREAALQEVNNFVRRGNWKQCPRSKPGEEGRKIIPVKWAFKKKREVDGTTRYKCRIVVKGFMQIPGTDFTEYFSPVVTDATIHMLYAMTLWHPTWTCHMFDVEAAFLNATLDKSMYIDWPPGITQLGFITKETQNNECIEFVKLMYGNVDAALRWMRTFY